MKTVEQYAAEIEDRRTRHDVPREIAVVAMVESVLLVERNRDIQLTSVKRIFTALQQLRGDSFTAINTAIS